MQVHMLAESAWGPQLPTSIVPTAMYGELHPGFSQVPVCLRNLNAHPTVVPSKVIIGKVTPVNQVPLVALWMGILGESACGPQEDLILDELDLKGLEDRPKEEQKQARELLPRWEHLFSHSDLDQGKAFLIQTLD